MVRAADSGDSSSFSTAFLTVVEEALPDVFIITSVETLFDNNAAILGKNINTLLSDQMLVYKYKSNDKRRILAGAIQDIPGGDLIRAAGLYFNAPTKEATNAALKFLKENEKVANCFKGRKIILLRMYFGRPLGSLDEVVNLTRIDFDGTGQHFIVRNESKTISSGITPGFLVSNVLGWIK
jgi:hypothetical protein